MQKRPTSEAWRHLDELLDAALEATFPASDAIAIPIGRQEQPRRMISSGPLVR